jgi:hypothetical protein
VALICFFIGGVVVARLLYGQVSGSGAADDKSGGR